jgi:hypothetical protein
MTSSLTLATVYGSVGGAAGPRRPTWSIVLVILALFS